MIRKLALLSAISILSLSLAGCGWQKISDDFFAAKAETEAKIENVKTEVERVSKNIQETKDRIEEKYEKGKKIIEAIEDFNETEMLPSRSLQ